MLARKSALAVDPFATSSRTPSTSASSSRERLTARASSLDSSPATCPDRVTAPLDAARIAADRVFDRVLLQDVAGGSGGEDLGHAHGVANDRVCDQPGARRGGEESLHELGPTQTFEGQLGHDHVRPRAHRGLHAPEGIRRDLDLQVVLPQQVVLEAGDLVGRVAEQHRGRHLQGVSALEGGG